MSASGLYMLQIWHLQALNYEASYKLQAAIRGWVVMNILAGNVTRKPFEILLPVTS